nr:hypothetical protein [Tanacetum cinerariifolium]
MRTRSSSNLPIVSPSNPSTSNPKRRNRRRSKHPFNLEESPVVTMADQLIMAELLRAPTEGYAEAIVVPPILAEQFKLKHSLFNMMNLDQCFGLEKDNPHDHILGSPPVARKRTRAFYSYLGGSCFQIHQRILSPSRTTNLRNEISNFQQRFNESFHEAWDRYKDLLRACPHHEIAKLTHAVNQQTSIVTTAMTAILKQFQATPPPASVKAVEEICVTCGGAHPELKCKALADLGASINLMPLSVWKKLGRPFLRTARALIDVHGEEMILRDGDERLTLNMRHDTSSYSNQPQKESINLINVFNDLSEYFLEHLFSTNQPSGNPTFSSHPELTSPKIKDKLFDPEGRNVLPEKLPDLDSIKDLHPPLHVNPLSGSTTYSSSPNQLLEEFVDELALITFPPEYDDDLQFDIKSNFKKIEYLLYHDPSLKDSIDQNNLADLDNNLVDAMPEMFLDEHALDYSSSPLFDEYDDDLFEVESDTENVYDDPFDSKGRKSKSLNS